MQATLISSMLSSFSYFKGLDRSALKFIEENSCLKSLNKGEYLFFAEDRCSNLYIITKGLIKVFLLGEDGKEVIIHYVGNGRLLGDTILFNEDPYGANAQVMEDAELIVIKNRVLEDIISRYPEVGIRMLADFGRRLKKMMMLMGEMTLSGVRRRLIRYVIELADEHGSRNNGRVVVNMVLKQSDIASVIGTKREVLCRELHRLEKDNLIHMEKGKIIIDDISKLRKEVYRSGGAVFPSFNGTSHSKEFNRKAV